ncbi:MAG: FAD-binding oxidoreductase [Chloroflexi bacterium]|nr:FAD-binding oxidoreductase [Chloroflexota bacterium]
MNTSMTTKGQPVKRRVNRTAFLGVAFAAAVAAAGWRYDHYAADPTGEKDCSPLFPALPPEVSGGARLELPPPDPALPWSQQNGWMNDASCLDRTPVYGVVRVTNEDDIRNTLALARARKLSVSIAGVRHSMGGHAFSRNAIVLDMTGFNKISLDAERKRVSVQSGATWHDIQKAIHPRFAVKAMQSTDIFTVGGSISVNAHGMDYHAGSIAESIRSLRIMAPDGTVQQMSRTQNPDLFRLVVGGYGLFGVILDADLDITDNEVYHRDQRLIDYTAFPQVFAEQFNGKDAYGLMYGHLSTSPRTFLKEMIVYGYRRIDPSGTAIGPLSEVQNVRLRRFTLNFSKLGSVPMEIKWLVEKYIEPRMEDCTVSRNQAMSEGEACLVSRNDSMHDSVQYLKNNLPDDTDILQEYFIPRAKFVPFVDSMREIMTKNQTNLLNASVRVVHKEDVFLNYAPDDRFAIVLYINQDTTPAGNERMGRLTRELIDLTTAVGGRFFLPYQLHYTPEQLAQAYPEVSAFFAAKRAADPLGLLTSTWYEKYGQAGVAAGSR